MSDKQTRRLLSAGESLSCIAFTPDGLRVFVGGTAAMVHMFSMEKGKESEESTTYNDFEGPVTSITTCADFMIAASEDSNVRHFQKNTVKALGNVTSTAGVGVRCVAVDPKGKWVAAGSEEPVIKLVKMEDLDYVQTLDDHTSGVRELSWHPTLLWLTVCGSNGLISVWDLSSDKPRLEKKLDGIIPAVKDTEAKEFKYDCSALWHPSGEYFFVANRAHEIVTISRSKWEKTSTFSDDKVSGTPTAMALSNNGVYLAVAIENNIHIWSTDTRRLILTLTTGSSFITRLAFAPTENLVAYVDDEGWYGQIADPIPSPYPSPVKPTISTRASASVQVIRPTDDVLRFDEPSGAFPGSDDDHERQWADLNDTHHVAPGHQEEEDDEYDQPPGPRSIVTVTEPQPPFQPGSTPMPSGQEHPKRYLAYNTLGVIEVADQGTHDVITTEFFDHSTRRGTHFNTSLKYDMGYLGERGALFACPPDGDSTAKVTYKPYGTWSTQTDWTYDLKRSGVRVLCIAAGSMSPTSSLRESDNTDLQGCGNVVIATSEGDLTFLSGTGRERRILGLGGDIISMVASVEWVFVVRRVGSTTPDGSQNLSYLMINFEDFTVRQADALPVTKGHVLKWIGVTEEGAPAIYDSSGRVHVLAKHRIPHHASWVRVMDTSLLERRQGKDESYWAIGINGSTFMCLILKGRQEHPGFPRPLIQELPITMPFRNDDPMQEQVEREMFLRDMILDSLDEDITNDDIISRERAMDKEFIQLIQNACKADNVPRAIELTKLLHNVKTLDAALKIADFYHLPGFKEKVERLKQIREEEEDRLVVAREKRRRWNKAEAPVRRLLDGDNFMGRPKPFQDFGPPPSISRPGLSRAQPSVASPSYQAAKPTKPWDDFDSMDTNEVPGNVTPEGKRKRTPEVEDSPADLMPPPKQSKPNPFARKPSAMTETSRNPFARRNDSNKVIQKSESFFEKVDAAESGAKTKRKVKEKEGKDRKDPLGPRQTTLFGMLPKGNAPNKKPSASRQAKEGDSQATDALMTDVPESDMTLVDTQQGVPTSDWEETQLNDEET